MAKYNEVMKHIEVTEEMLGRVLHNVENHFINRKKANRRAWLSVISGVAAAVIMLVISPWNNNPNITNPDAQNPPGVAGTYDGQEYASASELSNAVGFLVPELENLPFDVQERLYSSIDTDLAQIDYYGEGESLTFRKSRGTEDNSGDYNLFGVEKEVGVGQVKVTLKGEENSICIAIWTDGKYAYSLNNGIGLSEEEMTRLVEEIME